MQEACCSEVEKQCSSHELPSAPSPDLETNSQETLPAMKKRKVGAKRPQKKANIIKSFKPCTYCGENLSINVKCHWALKHAVEICREMGVAVDDVDHPVSAKDFMKHLDKVDHVYNSLNTHNYKVVPACTFFEIM